jgi:hypothetical protein
VSVRNDWSAMEPDEHAPLVSPLSPRPALPPTPRHSEPESLVSSCWRKRATTYDDVSVTAARAARELTTSLADPCSVGDPRVATCLARVWTGAGLGAVPPPIPDEAWKQIGFQGVDPLTDVRGARIAGLVYMARLVEEVPQSRAFASGDGFPFGIACLNVLFLLECHLRLGSRDVPAYCPCCGVGIRGEYTFGQPHRGKHIRGFANLLMGDYDALFTVYSSAVLYCARLWDGASSQPKRHDAVVENPLAASTGMADMRLLRFPQMLRATKDAVLEALAGTPPNLAALTTALARAPARLPPLHGGR